MNKYRYLQGGQDCFEAVEFDITNNCGQRVATCAVGAFAILSGIKSFVNSNGEDLTLTPVQQLKILELLQAERKRITDIPVKTLEGWRNSGLSEFDDYCFPGDEVDEAIVDYFMDLLPPATLRADCAQVGEPYNFEPDDDGHCRNTYITFHRIEGRRWRYDGHCFRGCNDNRVKQTYSQRYFEQLIDEARREVGNNV